jgi:predicted  nucleic acid-binding Zn-ribbon protein
MSDQTSIELAQLRAELHSAIQTMERIATAVEKTLGDHEGRLRELEKEASEARGSISALKWALGGVTVVFTGAVSLVAKLIH